MRPRFTLGLTATPERLDGGDIYALFDNVVAYEADLLHAVAHGWLSPFHYFGLPDTVDYSKLVWVGGSMGYREGDLTRELTATARMDAVVQALRDPAHAGSRTLVFCVSIEHARSTNSALRRAGLRVTAVFTGSCEMGRGEAIKALSAGLLDAIVSVDVFSEGVDIREVDRVVLLRPTDSATVFLQQIGRGMRLSPTTGKDHLKIIDFVGNHRRAKLRLGLLGVTPHDLSVPVAGAGFRRAWKDGRQVFVAPAALDAIRAVEGAIRGPRARIIAALRDLRDEARAGGLRRPRLLDLVSRTGLAPTTIARLFGSWFRLLAEEGALDPSDQLVVASPAAASIIEEVESTDVVGPHKMLLLGAMAERQWTRVDADSARDAMLEYVRRRHPSVQSRRDGRWKAFEMTKDVPRKYPMESLVKAHPRSFTLRNGEFGISVPEGVPPAALLDAVSEIADARLFQYVRTRAGGAEIEGRLVKQGSSSVYLLLGDQARRLGAKGAWIQVFVDAREYRAKVVEIAINVVEDPASPDAGNLAKDVLMRAVGASTVEEAWGRYLRFTPLAEGGFELDPG